MIPDILFCDIHTFDEHGLCIIVVTILIAAVVHLAVSVHSLLGDMK